MMASCSVWQAQRACVQPIGSTLSTGTMRSCAPTAWPSTLVTFTMPARTGARPKCVRRSRGSSIA